MSDGSGSSGIAQEEPRSVPTLHEYDVVKSASKVVTINSPNSMDCDTTFNPDGFRTQPEVVKENLNSLTYEFKKIHSKNVSKHKNLKNKLLQLEKKASSIKEYAAANCFPKAKYMTLCFEDRETERRRKPVNASNKSNTSITKYQSQQNTSNNYWKNKTASFGSSKLLPKKSPTLKSSKLNRFNEKEINKLSNYDIPKVQKKKSAMLFRQKFLSKNTPLGSFSKKMRSYHQKTKTMTGCMTSRAEKVHSRLQSVSVHNGENNFSSSIVSPTNTTKAPRTGNSFDFSSRMADLK